MKAYMLHTASLTVTAADRAVADTRRREVFAAGRIKPATADMGGVCGQIIDREKLTVRYGSVAVMHIAGAIAATDDDVLCWLMGAIPSKWIQEDARSLLADSTVETVVLALSTPGGAVAGFSGVSEALKALGAAKKLVGIVADGAYSLGCLIAGHCSEVYITPTGGMGNIGIIEGPFVDETKALEKAGVEVYYACSPSGKADGRPGAPVTPELRQSLGSALRVWYEELVSVFASRGLSVADIDGFNAGIFAARDAVTVGLADGVQTFDAVMGALIAGQPVPTQPDSTGANDDLEEPELITSPSGLSPGAFALESTMTLTTAQWGALTAEAVKAARPDLVTSLTPPAPTAAAPAPATIDELKAAFPGESEFIVDAASAKMTLHDANAKFVGVLRDRLTASAKALADAKAEAAASAAKPADPAAVKAAAHVAKVTTVEPSATPGNPTAAVCPFKTAPEAIASIAAEKRLNVAAAAVEAKKAWPELFSAKRTA